MKTAWDYSELATAYLKRPPYSPAAIDRLFALTGIAPGADVCDMGAGTAHLTLELVRRQCKVVAVEPNDAMRAHGIARTDGMGVEWCVGVAEESGLAPESFDLVTFGSSFNVTDRRAALKESSRILRSGGWFACMWNHRDLSDPIQAAIENTIKAHVPNYDYGARREEQTQIIVDSGLFRDVTMLEGGVTWKQSIDDCIEAWRSHGTLHRQAGSKFPTVIEEIGKVIRADGKREITVPYVTRMWLTQKTS